VLTCAVLLRSGRWGWEYTRAFDSVFDAEGIQVLRTPPRANAICERVVGTLRRELLDRILAPIIDLTGRRIKRRPVLGGLINEYEAA
jgi:hypothetical protein